MLYLSGFAPVVQADSSLVELSGQIFLLQNIEPGCKGLIVVKIGTSSDLAVSALSGS